MMNLSVLSQIEESISQLSLAEQLWLIERVPNAYENTWARRAHSTNSLWPWLLTKNCNRSCGASRRKLSMSPPRDWTRSEDHSVGTSTLSI